MEFPEDGIYVDLFGGSGLLSHTVKQFYPNSTVIWNDFDNYQKRLTNVAKTNKILEYLKIILSGHPKKEKLTIGMKEKVIDLLKNEEIKGYVDYLTLSSSLLFSGNYAKDLKGFEKQSLYNRITQSGYNCDGYLEKVIRVSQDYKSLYSSFGPIDRIIFLIDPPYLSTDTASYNSDSYWKLKDYLDVLNLLEGNNYFYFTSNKSQVIELVEWMGDRSFSKNPFENSNILKNNNNVSYTAKYIDIMIYKIEDKSK